MSDDQQARATALAAKAREPAVVSNVLFGTAGWTDPSLVKGGLFYPRGATSGPARLAYYAQHFSLVEVDATYYTLLPPTLAESWIASTAATFRFDVKAFPVLTGHPIDVGRLPADLRSAVPPEGDEPRGRIYPKDLPAELRREMEHRFRSFLEPLVRERRLGAVLLQFPPWFTATRGNARHLTELRERFGDVPLSVEFRHASWLAPERRERLFEMLEGLKLSYVVVDEPNVPSVGVPAIVRVTNPDLSIVRFHGHNAAGWRRGASVSERFDYLYTEAELASWVSRVDELGKNAKSVHVIFNNCVRNYAVLNAKGLSFLVGEAHSSGGEE